MLRITFILLSTLLSAGLLPAQDMIGIDTNGNVFGIDSLTGSGSPIGNLGYAGVAGLARNSQDELFAIVSQATTGSQALVQVDPFTGAGTFVTAITPLYPGLIFRGISFDAADVLYAEHTSSYLVTVDLNSGVPSFINKPNAFDVRSIAFVGADLYSWDLVMGLLKCDIVGTNWATNVNPNAPGSSSVAALTTSSSGVIYGAGDSLYTIGTQDGLLTLVGNGNWSGLTAIEFLGAPVTPQIGVSNLVGGQIATIDYWNMTAGGNVLIGYSLTGAGPTSTPLGIVDMSPPISQLPTMTADGAGSGGFSSSVPARASGFTLYMQAADLSSGELTNSLAQPIL
jgi:hypothetical protein